MSRPADLSKYVEGDPCPKCAGTMYRRKTVCVECERRANARRYAERTGIDYVERAPRPNISPTKLSSALEGYRRSPSARERSARLDALILGKKPDQEAPMTGGDVWRSTLPRGAPEKPPSLRSTAYDVQRPKRHAENAALTKAIRRIRASLPDIVRLDEIRRLLPPDAVEPINASRLQFAIATALAELGIVPPGTSAGRTRLYVVRRRRRYAGLSTYALEQVKAGNRPPAARGRSSNAKSRGSTPGDRRAAQRPSMGQREAPELTPGNRL
jgi:hypothetical protein